MAKNEKRQAAKDLYMLGDYTQVDIGKMLGVSETTLSKWKESDGWEDERDRVKRIAVSSETRIRRLIDYNLMVLEAKMDFRLASIDGEEMQAHELEMISSKETDSLSKLFAQIKRKELSIADYLRILTEFLKFLETRDLALAKTITEHVDVFRDKILNQK
ncbi:MAG: DUF1804 family protein [Saprospiraceae bacterium]|nr:DUF1804 family protein [Saprospiraceae bacterium]